MIRTFKTWLSVAALSLVAACGGGGGSSGDPVLGGGGSTGGSGTATAADLVVALSADSLANDGTSVVTATVTALDANRAALPGVAVQLSADSNAIVTLTTASGSGDTTTTNKSITNASGVITATVGAGTDRSLRTVTVTAKSGNVTKTATFAVVATPGAAVPSVIEVIASSTTLGSGGDQVVLTAFLKDANNNAMPSTPVTFTTDTGRLLNVSAATNASGAAAATLEAGQDKSNRTATVKVSSGTVQTTYTIPIVGTRLTVSGNTTLTQGNTSQLSVAAADSKGNPLPGVAITLASSLGNGFSPAAPTTDSSGQATVTYTATNAGTDTVRFSGAGAGASTVVTVSGEDFVFLPATVSPTVGAVYPLQVRYRRAGVPQANVQVRFAATVGTLGATQVTTDSLGVASVNLTSNFAAPSTISATVLDANGGTVAVATTTATFVATTPRDLVLQVSPSALAPNTAGGSDSQTNVIARVTDASGNPVQGLTVNFSQDLDPSGGRLSAATAKTGPDGQANVNYIAGASTTANNGVRLRATVATSSSVTGTVSLTVNQSALFIVLGTGNTITNSDVDTYQKTWTAYVTDANGIRVSGVTLTAKGIPTYYGKGVMAYDETAQRWRYVTTTVNSSGNIVQTFSDSIPLVCPNEDVNEDGRLNETDTNGDGQLTPGNVVALTSPTVVTDGEGKATITLRYAEMYAPWIVLKLTATGIVSGTESSSYREFALDRLASDFSNKAITPAGAVSPFGSVLSCTTPN
ncbi:Ig-like domain-containing protein [uncultured Aquincola sp.]|uniref:beta strand repeat-containing protein n=1 Tax=uncultured Aquincola sp. TaxID=886556 RepID=UPI0032B2E481